jgi:hypothetical protein
MPKEARAQEIAENFISSNPFFTILIKPHTIKNHQLVRFLTGTDPL